VANEYWEGLAVQQPFHQLKSRYSQLFLCR
jgi:hypothetical protein